MVTFFGHFKVCNIKSAPSPNAVIEGIHQKKATTVANERFTETNLIYTQLFIDYLNSKDPAKLLFFAGAGLKLPSACNRSHGHSPKGERCVEIKRYHEEQKD